MVITCHFTRLCYILGVHSSVDSLSERASVASGSSRSSEVRQLDCVGVGMHMVMLHVSVWALHMVMLHVSVVRVRKMSW